MNTSPREKLDIAVALKWDGDGAPRVSAKGKGELAERIAELAADHGIPLRHERELVELLLLVELDQEIPSSLYVIVAEVIAFAYSVKNNVIA